MKTTKLSQLNIVPEEYDIDHCGKVDYTDIHSEMTDIERRFVSGLIRYYEPSIILEVGVSRGGGTINILNAISDFDSKCISVDISDTWWGGDDPIGCDVDLGRLGVDSAKWDLLINSDPADVIEGLNTKFDFAVIDTAHLHPIESLNFLTVLPFLNDGAIVCLHDTTEFFATVNSMFASRILMMCVCADKIEPKILADTSLNRIDLPNIVAFQVTKDTRRYIRGVFDSFTLPWEIIPDKIETLASYFSRHYSEDLCALFSASIDFQYKYRFASLIGGIALSFTPKIIFFATWRDLGENIVFYGAGNEMMNLLQISEDCGLSFDFPIWDINANKIGTVNGHKVESPNFKKNATDNTKLCVTIKNKEIYNQVARQMSDLGYEVYHGIRALFDAVRKEYSAVSTNNEKRSDDK